MAKPDRTADRTANRSAARVDQKKRRTRSLTPLEVTDLAAFARCSAITVRRWSGGETVKEIYDEALTKFAEKRAIVVMPKAPPQ